MAVSNIPTHLVEAYRGARYRVVYGSVSFVFEVQQYSAQLARVLTDTRQSCATFITAHNPYSEVRDAAKNHAAHEWLRERLKGMTRHVFDAVGEDATGSWPDEPGFLALGVQREAARALGNDCRQNAIVWSGAQAVPELILLR